MAEQLEAPQQGSLDLGFLDELFGSEAQPMDELPGMRDEVVPVETFFDDYVSCLNAAAVDDEQHQNALPDGLPDDLLPVRQLQDIAGSSWTASDVSQIHGDSGTAPFVSNSFAVANSGLYADAPPYQAELKSFGQPGNTNIVMPSFPQSPTGAVQILQQPMGSSSGDDALHRIEHEKTKRSSRQQVQNKQAQQRYRQKRKQRFQDLEGALGQLSGQLKDKSVEASLLVSHNATLEGRTQELSLALATKEAEVDALRSQVVSLQATCVTVSQQRAQQSTNDGRSQQAAAPQGHAAALTSDEVSLLRQEHDMLVASMRQLAQAHGLQYVNPLGESVDANVLAQVRDLVGRACRSNQLLERKGGVQVLEVMTRRGDTNLGQVTCTQARARWAALMGSLQLAPRQEEALMALRRQHLARLANIYHHRQQLNSQAMGLMLPGKEVEAAESLSTKIACMSIRGYSSCADTTSQLYSILDLIKGNLREEQRAVMEMKLVVLHRVLSPIQCLLLVIGGHPSRPDALALCNSVAFKLGHATDGCPKAAQLLRSQAQDVERQGVTPLTQHHTNGSVGAVEPVSDGSSHRSDSCAAGM